MTTAELTRFHAFQIYLARTGGCYDMNESRAQHRTIAQLRIARQRVLAQEMAELQQTIAREEQAYIDGQLAKVKRAA